MSSSSDVPLAHPLLICRVPVVTTPNFGVVAVTVNMSIDIKYK